MPRAVPGRRDIVTRPARRARERAFGFVEAVREHPVEPEAAYEEDGWSWTESDAFLLEGYNLKLDPAFLARFRAG